MAIPKLQEIPLQGLLVDHAYGRKPVERHVTYLAEHWDPDAVGFIRVASRNGKLYVVDGQHRVLAARQLGLTSLVGVIREMTTREEEAKHFIDLNTSKAPRRFDLFRARLTAGDPDAIAIEKIVKAYGFRISDTTVRGDNITTAVSALNVTYARGHLEQVLDMSTRAFGVKATSASSYVIRALSMLLLVHGNRVDADRLVKAMRTKGIKAWLKDALDEASVYGGVRHRMLANMWLAVYNKGLRERKSRLKPILKYSTTAAREKDTAAALQGEPRSARYE